MKRYVVFIDFDNTITRRDVLDDMLERFSKDDRWIGLEEKWKRGEIGSRQCLEGQMKSISVTRQALDKYLSGVRVDPYFVKLIDLYKSSNIPSIILSDNFDYVLDRILKRSGVERMKVYSNKLRIAGDRLIPRFVFTNSDCGKCGHCKRKSLAANVGDGQTSVYIGDGLSDVDAATGADIVFAKDSLEEHFRRTKLPYIPFKGLKDVYDYFKERLL